MKKRIGMWRVGELRGEKVIEGENDNCVNLG